MKYVSRSVSKVGYTLLELCWNVPFFNPWHTPFFTVKKSFPRLNLQQKNDSKKIRTFKKARIFKEKSA